MEVEEIKDMPADEGQPLECPRFFNGQMLIDLMIAFEGILQKKPGEERVIRWIGYMVQIPDGDLPLNGFKTSVRFPTMQRPLDFEIKTMGTHIYYGVVSVNGTEVQTVSKDTMDTILAFTK